MTTLRIFLSHSSKDNHFGSRLAKDLRRALGDETAVWFDVEGGLQGGDAWWRKIVQEISSRNTFLVILSPEAMASNWVNDEIDIAWRQKNSSKHMLIIPLLYRPCKVRDDLQNLQIISFLQPKTYEAAFEELLSSLRSSEEIIPISLQTPPVQINFLSLVRKTVSIFHKWTVPLLFVLTLFIIGSVILFPSRLTNVLQTNTATNFDMTATAAAYTYATATTGGVMLGFDSAHTNSNPYEHVLNPTNITHLKLDWTYTTGSSIYSSPIVANGIVYVGSDDNKLYAFDAACRHACTPLWTYATGADIASTPAVANGILYVGSDDSKFYAFDTTCRRACTPLWTYATGGPLAYSPIVANGIVYIGGFDDKFYAFDAACRHACTPLWTYATGSYIASSPTVANGIVYISSDDNNLYAFDATCRHACTPLWIYNGIISTPTVANGIVYIGGLDGKLYAYDATCRSTICKPFWIYATGASITSSAAVANGIVYVSSGDHNLYAFDATCRHACTPLWTYTTGAENYSSPTVANGIVYVGSGDHNLYAFSATCRHACTPLWTYATGAEIHSSPTVANGIVYVGSADYKLYAFGLPLG